MQIRLAAPVIAIRATDVRASVSLRGAHEGGPQDFRGCLFSIMAMCKIEDNFGHERNL